MSVIEYRCSDDLLHLGAMFWFRLNNIVKVVRVTNSAVGCLCMVHILLRIITLQGKCIAGDNSRQLGLILAEFAVVKGRGML